MSMVVFLLGALLVAAGVAGAYMSLDLMPTGPGLLYAFSGAVAVVIAILSFALGVTIRRIDRLALLVQASATAPSHASVRQSAALASPGPAAPANRSDQRPLDEPPINAAEAEAPPADEAAVEAPAGARLAETEREVETPAAPFGLVGRYSSGGANYGIFADGSIQAETAEGAFKFGSIGEFKRFLADRREGKGQALRFE